MFELDNIKNEAILRDFLQIKNWADGLVPMRFAIFPLHLSKALRLPQKSDARSWEVLHLSRKIILANLQIWCSKMQPLSGSQRPDLITALMNMSLVLCLPRKMHLCRSSSNVPRLPSFLEMRQNPHVLLTFDKVHHPLRLPRKNDASTSKSGAYLWCFDFGMCFAPHRRALFRHLNFQKCWGWGALYILTWKCASRHNGVQFFISHLASWLRTRFSEPTFRPSGATNHSKNTVLRAFPTFSRTCIFYPSELSLLDLLCSSLLFSDSSHLCFSSAHIVGSLTSKLPSIRGVALGPLAATCNPRAWNFLGEWLQVAARCQRSMAELKSWKNIVLQEKLFFSSLEVG